MTERVLLTEEGENILNLKELFYVEKIRPEITLIVQGTPITFLCDSGACRTTLREPLPHAKPSGNYAVVRAAQGVTKRVTETEPIWLRDPEGKTCQLSVLILPECPVNLLGRDAMVALQLIILPTPDGLKIARERPENVYVMQGVGSPNYYYTLDIPNKAPTSTGSFLVDEGKNSIQNPQDVMSPDDLHVTMWYTNKPDTKYKSEFDKITPVTITVSYVYSDVTANAAAAVILPDTVKRLFRQYSEPHISLCKETTEEWKNLGQLVNSGERARNWVATGVNTWYSQSTLMTKKALFWTVTVQSGVHLDKKEK
ncbi:uncharacterized protein LOC124873533 isoform X1 [Girardinichthys multiradiatus]|uniref:uncharacterized protein LOC124873533 isoform X1 n=1 Tax=Girardinichthys multiradiatus TaxID=208333 RepID=UPI001FAB41CB|nr:uncharacterized protein LOC124873533 isoform X1 [Girardinichthys multiradiatus]